MKRVLLLMSLMLGHVSAQAFAPSMGAGAATGRQPSQMPPVNPCH